MTRPPFNGYGGELSLNDYDNLRPNNRVTSEIVGYNEYTIGTYVEFPILEENWDDVLWVSDGYAYFSMADATYDWNGYAPVWGSSRWFYFGFDSITLEIEKMQGLPERVVVVDSNAAVNQNPTGYETADNITWITPRAAYADESIAWLITGESGAALDLEVKDSKGNVLASRTDSVRIDGYYRYTVDLADNYTGFVRLTEKNHNLTGYWGYVSPAVSGSQEINTTYAQKTDYPQYTEPFSTYVVKAGELMALHWKTTLSETDLPLASVRMWYVGDSTKEVYNEVLTDLIDNYYLNTDDNDGMAAWRYILFTPDDTGTGWTDYDGMVVNLNQSYGWESSGFYQGLIFEDGESEFTETHTAHWYVADAAQDGIKATLDKAQYNGGATITARLYAGDASKVRTELNLLRVQVVNSSGTVVTSGDAVISQADTSVTLTAPQGSGDYKVRFNLTKANKSYIHVIDVPFKVAGTGSSDGSLSVFGTDIGTKINNTLGNLGLNNPTGYWIVMVILMGLGFFLFRKSEILRVVIPLTIMAIGIVIGWIETWIIVLLALGAGVTIFSMLRKKTQGGG
jgi:hypothetical protein